MCIRDRIRSEALDGFGDGRTVGVRAENVSVADGNGRLSCRVSESEFLGAETLIGLDHPEATGLTFVRPGLSLMSVGEEVSITFEDAHLHVFDTNGHRVEAR